MSKFTRRNVLRGLGGAVVALPFLESLVDKKKTAHAADVPPFAIFVRQGNGVAQATFDGEPERFWPTQAPGAVSVASLSADTGRGLSELGPYGDRLAIVRGINFGFPGNGCGHSGGGNQVLTAAQVSENPSGNESKSLGESIDNRITVELGAAGEEPLTLYAGRKLTYLDEVLSYRAPYELRAAERNPFTVYEDLFGLSNVDPAVLEALRARRKSVNDLVRNQMQALMNRKDLSKGDRDRLDLHFSSIRDLEVGLVCGLSDGQVADIQSVSGALDDDGTIEDVIKAHFDIIALTMACGVRRAATLQIGCGNDQTQYFVDGALQLPFHKISHRINSDGAEGDPIPNADYLHSLIDKKLLGLFRYLLDKLDSYEMPNGTLLDYGVACYTNDLSDKWHSYENVPYILAGSAGGFLKTGVYVDAGGVTNNKILNTIGAAVGCKNGSGGPLDDFGDPSLDKGLVDAIVA